MKKTPNVQNYLHFIIINRHLSLIMETLRFRNKCLLIIKVNRFDNLHFLFYRKTFLKYCTSIILLIDYCNNTFSTVLRGKHRVFTIKMGPYVFFQNFYNSTFSLILQSNECVSVCLQNTTDIIIIVNKYLWSI